MKKITSVGVIMVLSASVLSASVLSASASESMMMSASSSMSSNTMSMQSTMSPSVMLKSQAVSSIAKKLGYNWFKDRVMLAKMANVENYRGTLSQNLVIKKYLISVYTESVMVGGAAMVKSRDIVDNAVRANNVTTVVAAVKAAGLVDTLKSAGPFTVFAPNNMAFEKLPAGTVESILKPENKNMLVSILTYHVVAGKYTSADITDGMTLKTVEGKNLTFKKDSTGKIWINGVAMIETKNVISTNGVTHVIDGVLLPPQ